jgi:gamma-glutamyltranspeptidase/glutathione hydrolase
LVITAAAAFAAGPAADARGAVACAAPAAADAGAALLAAGGNAADAAVAAALALAVVHPQAGNLGGGGFAVVRAGGELAALDFRETAPAAATRTMFLGPDGEPVAERSLVGALAAGVPGSPAGLYELHRRFGRRPWREVVAPAVRLARDGFVVTPRLEKAIAADRALLSRFASTAAVWLPGGAPPRAGTTMRLPRLADTLAAYAEHGPAAITSGPRASAIASAVGGLGGVLTAADLAAYAPVWREPLRFAVGGWEAASMPLPSAGGIILAQSTAMLARLDWEKAPRGSAERAHLLAEVLRRAYADRYLLGDPATAQAGPLDLLSGAWIARRAAAIDRRRATPSAAVRPWSRAESSETTHLSAVDAEGGAVAMTTTINASFGCGLLVAEVGFLLNNEMDDFTAAPGRPNYFGLVQGDANAVAPGRRMLSSMSPTILWRGTELVVLGSPGGSTIPTATLQVLANIVVDGDSLREAIARPRMHHQWQPDRITHEAGAFAPAVAAELKRRGHQLAQVGKLGEVHAVRVLASGAIVAVADPRGPGATAEAGSRRAARGASREQDPAPPGR